MITHIICNICIYVCIYRKIHVHFNTLLDCTQTDSGSQKIRENFGPDSRTTRLYAKRKYFSFIYSQTTRVYVYVCCLVWLGTQYTQS